MFSGYAVYLGDRIVCMLRDHVKSAKDNGLWLVLSESVDPADRTLRKEFPSLRPIELLGEKISHWLVIPSDSPTFEEEALHACDNQGRDLLTILLAGCRGEPGSFRKVNCRIQCIAATQYIGMLSLPDWAEKRKSPPIHRAKASNLAGFTK
jgi:hypothetical protein